MRFLLDTDHISIIQAETAGLYENLTRRLDEVGENDLALSIVSFHEQTLGANNYIAQSKSASDTVHGYELFERVRVQYSEMNVLPFDLAAATIFHNLRRRRVRISMMDLRIASVALANDLTLLTRNTVDFSRVPGLQFEDWTL